MADDVDFGAKLGGPTGKSQHRHVYATSSRSIPPMMWLKLVSQCLHIVGLRRKKIFMYAIWFCLGAINNIIKRRFFEIKEFRRYSKA